MTDLIIFYYRIYIRIQEMGLHFSYYQKIQEEPAFESSPVEVYVMLAYVN